MFVTGRNTPGSAAHAPFGAKFRVYEIHRNEDDIAPHLRAGGPFLDRPHPHWHPTRDGRPHRHHRHLGRLPADAGEIVDLSDLSAEFARLEALRATRANTEERIDAIENAIKARMGSATEAMVGGRVAATWRQSDRTTIDTKALKAAMPDVADEFSKTSSSRRFLLKPRRNRSPPCPAESPRPSRSQEQAASPAMQPATPSRSPRPVRPRPPQARHPDRFLRAALTASTPSPAAGMHTDQHPRRAHAGRTARPRGVGRSRPGIPHPRYDGRDKCMKATFQLGYRGMIDLAARRWHHRRR